MENASEDYYTEELNRLEEENSKLQDELNRLNSHFCDVEEQRDDLQRSLDDITEDDLLAAKLLIQLWTSLSIQTEFDKDIDELIRGYPQLLPKYYTPYFLK